MTESMKHWAPYETGGHVYGKPLTLMEHLEMCISDRKTNSPEARLKRACQRVRELEHENEELKAKFKACLDLIGATQ